MYTNIVSADLIIQLVSSCRIHDLVYTNVVPTDLITQLPLSLYQVSLAFPLNLLDGKLDSTSSVVQFWWVLPEGSRPNKCCTVTIGDMVECSVVYS